MPLEHTNPAAELSTAAQWHSLPEHTGMIPEPAIHSWLQETGLLTARLRTLCADSFQLEVLEHSPPSAAQPAKRRIVLWCGTAPCIYAETIIPATTIDAHPWLATLGDEPLGERLSSQPNVSRSEFRFCQIAATTIPAEIITSTELHWSRQSDFKLASHPLTVTEVFLPGLLECQNAHAKNINA
jgi:chorismate--pyruvate lyase